MNTPENSPFDSRRWDESKPTEVAFGLMKAIGTRLYAIYENQELAGIDLSELNPEQKSALIFISALKVTVGRFGPATFEELRRRSGFEGDISAYITSHIENVGLDPLTSADITEKSISTMEEELYPKRNDSAHQ